MRLRDLLSNEDFIKAIHAEVDYSNPESVNDATRYLVDSYPLHDELMKHSPLSRENINMACTIFAVIDRALDKKFPDKEA